MLTAYDINYPLFIPVENQLKWANTVVMSRMSPGEKFRLEELFNNIETNYKIDLSMVGKRLTLWDFILEVNFHKSYEEEADGVKYVDVLKYGRLRVLQKFHCMKVNLREYIFLRHLGDFYTDTFNIPRIELLRFHHLNYHYDSKPDDRELSFLKDFEFDIRWIYRQPKVADLIFLTPYTLNVICQSKKFHFVSITRKGDPDHPLINRRVDYIYRLTDKDQELIDSLKNYYFINDLIHPDEKPHTLGIHVIPKIELGNPKLEDLLLDEKAKKYTNQW